MTGHAGRGMVDTDAGHIRRNGQEVYEDLLSRVTLSGLAVIGINSRRLTENEARVPDDLATVCTLADPRISPKAAAHEGNLERRVLPERSRD